MVSKVEVTSLIIETKVKKTKSMEITCGSLKTFSLALCQTLATLSWKLKKVKLKCPKVLLGFVF